MTLRIHEQAREEYRRAALSYAERSRHSGMEFVERFEQTLASIQRFPFARHALDSMGTRQALLRQFPYKLVYAVERDAAGQESVVIYAVAHVRRKPGYWSGRLPSGEN